jgi:EAL domain-containing protein (putative c-di-GMP-specific phosphodiesterase class I)
VLHYQPLVDLRDGRVVAVEALVRWRHPTRGLVEPADFIPAAERIGLIVPLGRWVLREACRQAAAWRSQGTPAPPAVTVNVSARQLKEPGFVAEVADALGDEGLDPASLVVEITETAVVEHGPVLDALRDLHALGVRLALDDFGTGHSSLGQLLRCPVDLLKVDRSFVDGVSGSREQTAVAAAISQMALALGLEAVAEGIETRAQADRLRELGYRLGQGYYFSEPLPPERLAGLPWTPRPTAVYPSY